MANANAMVDALADEAPAAEGVFALSPLQQAYFLGRNPDFDLHVEPHLFLEFQVSRREPGWLSGPLQTLSTRHVMLRARMTSSGQLVIRDGGETWDVPETNLDGAPAAEQTARLQSLRHDFERANMDAESGTPLRVHVVHISAERSHVLLNFHLAFFDGGSVRILLRELSQLAQGAVLSEHHVFDARWFAREAEGSERRQAAWRYWQDRLATLPGGPELPVSTPRSPERSSLVRRRERLSAGDWQALVKRALRAEVGPSAVLFTAYTLVVAYFSKTAHFSATMMLQDRPRHVPEGAVGNFASTVLVEVDYREATPFGSRARQVQTQLLRDLRRVAVSGLEVLQERNRRHRTLAQLGSPVAFVSMVEDTITTEHQLFQFEGANLMASALETPQVLLDHQAVRGFDGGISLLWDTLDARFPPQMVEQMFDSYVSLVRDLATSDAAWQRTHYDFRSSTEKRDHANYNAVSMERASGTLNDLLPFAARAHGDKPLIITAERSLTFTEVFRGVNNLSRLLQERGSLSDGELVAIVMHKGWEQVVAAQAIVAAGGAYVPIDASLPTERIRYIFDQCRVRQVLTQSAYLRAPWLEGVRAIAVDDVADFATDRRAPASAARRDSTAYIIFTSGSTGRPKGVTLDHAGPLETIVDINRRFGIGPDDCIFGISSLSFDLSVYDVFGSVAAGASLVLPGPRSSRDPSAWLELVQKHGVSVWNSVPALAQLLVEHVKDVDHRAKLPLRTVLMSGDWIPLQLPAQLREVADCQVVSLGGATEASIWSIYYPIERLEADWRSIPYGYPLTNQRMYVLDSSHQPRPNDVPGQIFIGGDGVAKGYHADAEKTRKAFISHPLTQERLYATGDWGCMRRSGYMEFLGREDSQVKIRGHRVELGEIEAVLQQHPAVANAAVVVRGAVATARELVAYVAPSSGQRLNATDVQRIAREQLPEYMVPARVVVLDQLPLNRNHKVDRAALPDIDSLRPPAHSGEFALPGTETERQLVTLWENVLSTRVSTRSTFNELGGSSFAAVRLMALVSQRFGVKLPLATLLRADTVSALAREIDQQRRYSDAQLRNGLLHSQLAGNASAKPTWWMHPSGGNVLCYAGLARLLEPDFATFAFRAAGLQEDVPLPESIEQMAENYAQELLEAQPEGPYRLGGWSLGGVVAFEIAQRLQRLGREVSHLCLIDSPAPVPSAVPERSVLLRWFVSDLRGDSQLARSQDQEPDMLQGDAALQRALAAALPQVKSEEMPEVWKAFLVFERNIRILRSYRGPVFSGPGSCLVISANESAELQVPRDSQERWLELLPESTTTISFPGTHYQMLVEPVLSSLGLLVRQFMHA